MKIFKNVIFLFSLILLTFLSCSEDDTDQTSILETTVIERGVLTSNYDISNQNIVISTQKEWQDFLERMETYSSYFVERFSETDPDFENVQVLAVFDGQRAHTGCLIKISAVHENENTLVATVIKEDPGAGYAALSWPYQIVSIKKSNKPVLFE